MKRVYHKLIPIALIILITLSFFANLFYPHPSLFSTPDFGESDIWQLNLPLKFFLADSLKSGHWPLWDPYIANGFPQLAEGQIGTFNLFNLILFRFLPFIPAYNIGFIIIFLTASIGTYLYCREIKLKNFSSLFAGLLFGFSGLFIVHVSHYNLIQTASFLPWLFLALENIFHKNKIIWGSVFSLILAEQIFSGFPQLVFISLIGILFYIIFNLKIAKIPMFNKSKIAILIIIFLVLGFLLASVQLLPQKEFLDTSNRSAGFSSNIATLFSYPPKHLISLVFPYFWGDPRKGTYPDYVTSGGSIFWENTAYIGIIPLILAFLSLILIKKNKLLLFYWLLTIFSFLMMLGKYSPFYFIFPIPPFSFFRVPSRFILLFLWSLVILSSITFNFFLKKIDLKLILVLFGFALFQLFRFTYYYNPVVSADKILANPQISNLLLRNNTTKIYSHGSSIFWNKVFNSEGWQNINKFLFFKNALLADQNLIYKIPAINTYRAQTTRRYDIIQNAIDNISINPITNTASLSSTSINLLKIYSVNYIITQIKLSPSDALQKIGEVPSRNNIPSFSLYQIKDFRPEIYLTNKFHNVTNIPDYMQYVGSGNIANGQNQIVLEQKISNLKENENLFSKIYGVKTATSEIDIDEENNTPAVLVINQSFYPGWKALVNNKSENLIPVNVNQQGLIVPEGTNHISFYYEPQSFKWGKIISLISVILIGLLFTSQVIKFRFRRI